MNEWTNKIYCGDCVEILPIIPNNSIDLIFADPPYNIGVDYGDKINDDKDDYFKWSEKWLIECVRVLKDTGNLFVMNFARNLAHYMIFLNKYLHLKNYIVWIRNDNQIYSKHRMFKPNHQDILFYSKSMDSKFYWRNVARRPIWYKDKRVKDLAGQFDTWSDITIVKGNSKEKVNTPNQLPLKILERIILCSTDKGDIVLDPFMGSGTTGLVSKQLNRNWIGIELNFKFAEEAIYRIGDGTVELYDVNRCEIPKSISKEPIVNNNVPTGKNPKCTFKVECTFKVNGLCYMNPKKRVKYCTGIDK